MKDWLIALVIIGSISFVYDFNGCDVSIGDTVKHKITGDMGVVESIEQWGAVTKNCKVNVRYKYRFDYKVNGFEFEVIANKGE